MSNEWKLKLAHAWAAINPVFNIVALLVLVGILNSSDTLEKRITVAGFVIVVNLIASIAKTVIFRPDGNTSVNKAYAYGAVRMVNSLAEIIALVVIFLPVGLTAAAVAVIVGVVLAIDLVVEIIEFVVMS